MTNADIRQLSYAFATVALIQMAFFPDQVNFPSVLLWLVVLANAQVSRLLQPPAAPVVVGPDAELRKELDDLKGKVTALSLAKGIQRR